MIALKIMFVILAVFVIPTMFTLLLLMAGILLVMIDHGARQLP